VLLLASLGEEWKPGLLAVHVGAFTADDAPAVAADIESKLILNIDPGVAVATRNRIKWDSVDLLLQGCLLGADFITARCLHVF
jgi:hypothetical protein